LNRRLEEKGRTAPNVGEAVRAARVPIDNEPGKKVLPPLTGTTVTDLPRWRRVIRRREE